MAKARKHDSKYFRKLETDLLKQRDKIAAELKEVMKQAEALEKQELAERRAVFAAAFEKALADAGVTIDLSREVAIDAAAAYIALLPEEGAKGPAAVEDGAEDHGKRG